MDIRPINAKVVSDAYGEQWEAGPGKDFADSV